MIHAFLLGLAFGGLIVMFLAGACRLDRYENDLERRWSEGEHPIGTITRLVNEGEESQDEEAATASTPPPRHLRAVPDFDPRVDYPERFTNGPI
jgi:hypothetical protein